MRPTKRQDRRANQAEPQPTTLAHSSSPSLLVLRHRITYEDDQKLSDAGTFTLLKEDHTLGNPLRMSLLADGRVLFAGYRMPHPLENRMIIRIKVRPGHRSENKERTRKKRKEQSRTRSEAAAVPRLVLTPSAVRLLSVCLLRVVQSCSDSVGAPESAQGGGELDQAAVRRSVRKHTRRRANREIGETSARRSKACAVPD